jgi:hypothetical protein
MIVVSNSNVVPVCDVPSGWFGFVPLCVNWKSSITSQSTEIENRYVLNTERKLWRWIQWWRHFRSIRHPLVDDSGILHKTCWILSFCHRFPSKLEWNLSNLQSKIFPRRRFWETIRHCWLVNALRHVSFYKYVNYLLTINILEKLQISK